MTWATAAWSAAVNQNLLHPDTAPAARALEHLVAANPPADPEHVVAAARAALAV